MKKLINWFYKTIFEYFYYLQDFEDAVYSTNLLFTLSILVPLLSFILKINMMLFDDISFAILSISGLVFCYLVYRIINFTANRYLTKKMSIVKPIEKSFFIKGLILQIFLLLISLIMFFVLFRYVVIE